MTRASGGDGLDDPDTTAGYSVEQVSEQVGICRDGIYSAIRRGDLVAVKWGRRTIIRHRDLVEFLDRLPRLTLPPEAGDEI